jgi:Protein of unknown function (DUF2971)
MWAQYSDNHAGICLCFNEAQLISEAEKQLGPAPGKRLKHQLVSYASEAEYPPGPALLEPEAGQDLRAFIVSMLDCKSDLFFTKDWDPASETEYRFLLWGETQDNEEIDIQDSLEAVIAGPRFHPVYRPGLYKLCHELGVEALQIEWRRGHPPAIVRMPDPSSQSLKL